ncbi:DUF881 domain-containing protein [Kyrpidia tusciae]|uniref:DUF881 domain-containing protein n=1 Tax=Kyrpidia tusciae (strain DSM 2912 / NBRC 15312 / T2) TaxID=562970 RepID=D5WQN9_KYRT2|nr:DUF881 domain-containing protein [Kyrpidia tusciae]ADG06648.1 protein of unknown function DUF881 [Kyrpidia tusciae DSM 2912]
MTNESGGRLPQYGVARELRQKLILYVSLAMVFFVLGWLLTVQYRSLHSGGNTAVSQGASEVVHQLEAVKARNQQLESQVQDIQKQIDGIEKQYGGNLASFEQMRMDLDRARILAGAPVSGPGVTVTLDNGRGTQTGADRRAVVVEEWDVVRLVQELLAGGAEAVAVNGQRWAIVDSPAPDSAPVHLHAPYQIQAIGDPGVLMTALSMRGGILDWLQQRGLTVSTPKAVNTLHLPGYDGRRWTFDIRQ